MRFVFVGSLGFVYTIVYFPFFGLTLLSMYILLLPVDRKIHELIPRIQMVWARLRYLNSDCTALSSPGQSVGYFGRSERQPYPYSATVWSELWRYQLSSIHWSFIDVWFQRKNILMPRLQTFEIQIWAEIPSFRIQNRHCTHTPSSNASTKGRPEQYTLLRGGNSFRNSCGQDLCR